MCTVDEANSPPCYFFLLYATSKIYHTGPGTRHMIKKTSPELLMKIDVMVKLLFSAKRVTSEARSHRNV